MTTAPLDFNSLVRAARSQVWAGLPAGTTLGHMHLHVGDLAGAETFYHHALGFDKVVWSYPGALFFSVGGYHHHLGTNTWAAGAPPAREDDARLLEWELLLAEQTDVDAAATSCRVHGFAAAVEGQSVVLRDPWMTALRLRAAHAA